MPATPEKVPAEEAALFAPLERFYRKSGVGLPEVELVPGDVLPEPARELLVHGRDMTSTLSRFHGAAIGLRVCSVGASAHECARLVVLFRADTGVPVEFGAIRIFLDPLPAEVRDAVREGDEPLGGILERYGVGYRSEPRAFFRFHADAFVGVLLDRVVREPLYGRCNVLRTADGVRFAEIVEILPNGGGD